MELTNKEKAVALIEAFETGNSKVLDYISDEKYIQHNPFFPDGKEAIIGFFQDKPTGITVKVHRAIEDGNFVALHNTYGGVWNNGIPQVAFDVFRFENGLIVEHWDNLVDIREKTASGHSQIDGLTSIGSSEKYAETKKVAEKFANEFLLAGDFSNLEDIISSEKFIQHNPDATDGIEGFHHFLKYLEDNKIPMIYENVHHIITEGNFTLLMSNGSFGDDKRAFYDLFVVEDGKFIEHWDVVTTIPAKEEWKNQNDKF